MNARSGATLTSSAPQLRENIEAVAGKRRRHVACTAALAATLAVAAIASLGADLPASEWNGETTLLPEAAAFGAGELFMDRDGDHATQHALHRPAVRLLHPTTLTLSGYPTVGGGTAELVFTVTYAGNVQSGAGSDQGPVVRLDVTGSEYSDLYRVTDITSNIGTAAPDIFEPYDHEAETARAERGATYTVRAVVEFLAEDFIPVYAIGFDGDVATANVAASKIASMPYTEYVATQQIYLDRMSVALEPDPAAHVGASGPGKQRGDDHFAPILIKQPQSLPPHSFEESTMPQVFSATGTVLGADASGALVPVHGIVVCVYDRPLDLGPPYFNMLNTTAGVQACDYTDTEGQYDIVDVINVDPDDSSLADVFISVESLGYDGAISLQWYSPDTGENDLYYVDSGTEINYNGAALVKNFNLHDDDPGDGGMAGAARIVGALSDGMAFFERYDWDPTTLTVWWNYMDAARVFPGVATNGGQYHKGDDAIYLDGNNSITYDESRDRHTILHEFGHYVHDIHDPKFEYACPVHSFEEKYDERCAWAEGWANLVPHLVDDAVDVPIALTGYGIDIEAGVVVKYIGGVAYIEANFTTFEESGRPVGERVEGSVAAAMWDMADDEVDDFYDRSLPDLPMGSDSSSAGVDGLLGVFFDGTYDSFADFYDRWEIDMRSESAESIAILHGMSFAIPSNTSYYGFVDELGGVFRYEMSYPLHPLMPNLQQFRPNYVAVSGDGSTVAVASLYGQGLQIVDSQSSEHRGLYATQGYNQACTLEADWLACMLDYEARSAADLGEAEFSSMDGIAFGLDSSVILVSDGPQNRVQVIGSDGVYLGMFGATGDGRGEFNTPDGIAFLADDTTAAVADSINTRIQTFNIAGDGSVQHTGEFKSYMEDSSATYQQLAAGPDGTLYAAGYVPPNVQPHIWMYPLPLATSNITRIDDPSLNNLGGIAVDRGGLVYVSDPSQGRVRVYDLNSLRGGVNESTAQIDGRPMTVRQVLNGSNGAEAFIDEFGSRGPYAWQLGVPTGVALGMSSDRPDDVRVYVADRNGVKMYEKDRVSPRVESVWAHTADKTVVPGDVVEIAVNFTERVTVTGAPALTLETGAAGSSATYVSGSGSRTLTFNYTVDAGAGSSYIDYENTGSLSLLAGGDPTTAIVDGSGNAADLTLPDRGTAASLAVNAALWVGISQTDVAPFGIAALPPVEAYEHRQVRFDVVTADGSARAALGSYSLIDPPTGATISDNGTFEWTPDEEQNGRHEFAVNASQQGDPATSHARTFRVFVAEVNAAPVVDPVPDMRTFALSELRFNIAASDTDIPAQDLEYWLEGDWPNNRPNFATVLPNGTFVWTPSEYDIGTTTFNVTVVDGFEYGNDGSAPDYAPVVEFAITVVPKPPPSPVLVYAQAPDGSVAVPEPAYTAGQAVRIGVEFSEAVTVQAGPGGGTPYLALSTGGATSALAPYDSGSGTDTLAFVYTVRDGDATDRLSYAGTGALVLNGSTLDAPNSEEQVLTALPEPGDPGSLSNSSIVRIDALRPTVESVYALDGDGSYGVNETVSIAARFSESVIVAGSPAITLAAGPMNRDAAYYTGNATNTLTFKYTVQAGDNASRLDYTGTDALKTGNGSSIRDMAGNGAVLALPAPGTLGSLGHNNVVSLGEMTRNMTGSGPGNGGQNMTAGNAVTLVVGQGGIDGSSNVTASGDEARITLNVGALSSSGTAEFPPDEPIVVSASFATVSFPPGVTATSVPADGMLVMYVADGVPDNSTVQEALGYGGSGNVTVQRVVEIGDEDGRIVFNIPVRISLEGLAGARAFYIGEDNSTITSIDTACAADDAERVHRHLDGRGECHLDAGGDKVIYTYHLTRFGAASPESGAPSPPADHTCSVGLERQNLGMQVRPGETSSAAEQTVVNTGSLPFVGVGLEATPWYVNLGGAEPGPDTLSLPDSITGVSEGGESGAYRTVDESGTTVSGGLGGGDTAPLWFQMSLAADAGVRSGELTQEITYLAECRQAAEWQQQ